MKKGILLTGVCILAVAAGFAAGSLNSSAHHFAGSTYHHEDCAAGSPITGSHHLEYCGDGADYWEQCSQQVHHSEMYSSDPAPSEPEVYSSDSAPSEPEVYSSDPAAPEPEVYNSQPSVIGSSNCDPSPQIHHTETHHTESHHGHGGRHH